MCTQVPRLTRQTQTMPTAPPALTIEQRKYTIHMDSMTDLNQASTTDPRICSGRSRGRGVRFRRCARLPVNSGFALIGPAACHLTALKKKGFPSTPSRTRARSLRVTSSLQALRARVVNIPFFGLVPRRFCGKPRAGGRGMHIGGCGKALDSNQAGTTFALAGIW